MHTIILTALVVALALALCLSLGFIIAKGGKAKGAVEVAGKTLEAVDTAVDTLKEIAPGIPYIGIISKAIDWAKVAVQGAERMYKENGYTDDKRAAEAQEYVYKLCEAAGVEVDNNLKYIINGAIKAAVELLPPTNAPSKSADIVTAADIQEPDTADEDTNQ